MNLLNTMLLALAVGVGAGRSHRASRDQRQEDPGAAPQEGKEPRNPEPEECEECEACETGR